MRTAPHRGLRALLLGTLFCCLFTTGCLRGPQALAPDPYRPTTARMVDGLPFHPQETYQCGPASLAGVMNHLGRDVTPDDIAAAIFRSELHGTLSLDLALYPRTVGMQSRFYEGSVADIQASVDSGIPLVVMIDNGIGPVSSYHFMVVAGYAPDAVIANSGRTQGQRLPWDEFLPKWDRTGRWTLRVERP